MEVCCAVNGEPHKLHLNAVLLPPLTLAGVGLRIHLHPVQLQN